ncbi:hypothetical protein [Streptomyces sp. 840.1]|uniref:hypothetical protein n=1 Tax=Streptomyces sp. 840.1 TaxID=2485152 RepID=UPI0037D9C6D2
MRFPADVPSAGRCVVLRLRVRRFTCRNAECPRRTFVEQIPGLTRRHSQRTERQRSTLAAIGLALAGRAGARLADIVGVPVSRSTVLRLVDALPEPEAPVPRVVGVDEYATRKARHYGTVLVNVETRRPIGPTGNHLVWPRGWPSARESRSCAGTEHRSSPREPPSVPRKPCRSRTGGTSGTTPARPPSGASLSTANVCASWSPRCLNHPRLSLAPRRSRPARHGRPATDSPTEPGPCTPPSMLW